MPFAYVSPPAHGGWRWQLLISQFPAGKSKAIPSLHSGLQLSKITKKNDNIPYNMRCWKCCPPSYTHFCHHFRKCAFTPGIGGHVLNEVSRVWRCRGSKYIPLPKCLHLQRILNDQGRTLLAYLLGNMSLSKQAREKYISRIVEGEVFLLCTRWQCKMFVVLDS